MDWFWIFVAWLVSTTFRAAVPAVAIALAGWLIWRRAPRLRTPLAAASVVVAVGWMAACVILDRWPPGPPVRLLSATILRQDLLWVINPLGLAATALAPFAVRSARRRTVARAPANTSRSPRWLSFLPVGFLLLVAAAYVVYVWPPLPAPLWCLRATGFDADRWQAADEAGYRRAFMLRSLFRDEHVTGKTRTELVSLLGAPDSQCLPDTEYPVPVGLDILGPPQTQAVTGLGYFVGFGWDIDPWELAFYFGPDGQVWAHRSFAR